MSHRPWPGPGRPGDSPPSNSACPTAKLEGLNSKTRLINYRGYGHHTAAALIAMIYLCSGGITIQLPTRS